MFLWIVVELGAFFFLLCLLYTIGPLFIYFFEGLDRIWAYQTSSRLPPK